MAKRHDINPRFLSGSGCRPKEKDATCSENQNLKYSVKKQSPFEQDTSEEDDSFTESPSTSKSAKRRRVKNRENSEEGKVLDFFKSMHEERKEERTRKEGNRNQRATERNDLLRQFIDEIKKK